MNVLKLKKEESALIAIDFQERLMPAMHEKEQLSEYSTRLIKGCRVLGIPTLITQQYTKGLGETTAPIQEAFTAPLFDIVPEADFSFIEKTTFSAALEPAFTAALKELNRKTLILCGMEAHICVQQTALDLVDAGFNVFIAGDCISSRTMANKEYSQMRMAQAGCVITNYESILFDLLMGAKMDGFKQINAIVK